MKKLICLLLSMIMLMGVLGACSTPAENPDLPEEPAVITQEQLIKHYKKLSIEYERHLYEAIKEHGEEMALAAHERTFLSKESGKYYYSALEQFTDTESADEFMRAKIKQYDQYFEDYAKDQALRERLETIYREQKIVESENFSLKFSYWGTDCLSSMSLKNAVMVESSLENVTFNCYAFGSVQFYAGRYLTGTAYTRKTQCELGSYVNFDSTDLLRNGHYYAGSHKDFLYAGYCGIRVYGDAGLLGYAVVKVYFDVYPEKAYYEVLAIKSYEIGEDGKTHPNNSLIVEGIVLKDCTTEKYGKEYADELDRACSWTRD